MSILDKVIASVTPPESEEQRQEATDKARAAAFENDWLSLALDHHEQIRALFEEIKAATEEAEQCRAQLQLKSILMGHSIAEEAVLYPALALDGEKAHAEMGYNEQAMVKIQMAALDDLPLLSQQYLDKLEHIQGAVLHHMYQEEGTWFLELKDKATNQEKLTTLFQKEFERYAGDALEGEEEMENPADLTGSVDGSARFSDGQVRPF